MSNKCQQGDLLPRPGSSSVCGAEGGGIKWCSDWSCSPPYLPDSPHPFLHPLLHPIPHLPALSLTHLTVLSLTHLQTFPLTNLPPLTLTNLPPLTLTHLPPGRRHSLVMFVDITGLTCHSLLGYRSGIGQVRSSLI
ncbi:hypothetical protein Pmani_023105 [Petrolisthes manimaculis]|uniref:Uncharacterized protein n=1 Tax=Petrolisthes manimaculis TaxID=1843537 RepID=A0AAE1TZY2_9EUCA|nr:hypothetical protein Pmani_023105 [Petrolisthes manimaculis]